MALYHGLSWTPEWAAWRNMKLRCSNPNIDCWERYGGRGIKVCERWQNSFLDFLEDVGWRPSMFHSIDRINNDGDYEPGNVRWATALEQSHNQRVMSRHYAVQCSICRKIGHNRRTCKAGSVEIPEVQESENP